MRRLALALLLACLPVAASAAPCAGFTDVDDANPAHAPFCASVEWMKNRGITLGLTPTLYDPNSPVTRLQMAAFMYRLGYQNAFLQGGNAFGTVATLGTTDSQPLDIRVFGSRAMRYQWSNVTPNVIGGSSENVVTGFNVTGATIAGGGGTISEIGFVEGGPNRVSDDFGTVGGGSFNSASGFASTVPGGLENTAGGNFSFAAGHRAKALGHGSFSFADSRDHDFSSSQHDRFRVRATGGVTFVTEIGVNGGGTWSCVTEAGFGWICTSDRNQKQNLRQLDGEAVLERLLAMPVFEWYPKGRNAHVRHYGPMAQDFHAAFGLGNDDTMIGFQDVDGVALAAIQGLNAKLQHAVDVRDATIAELKASLAEVAARLEKLEADRQRP